MFDKRINSLFSLLNSMSRKQNKEIKKNDETFARFNMNRMKIKHTKANFPAKITKQTEQREQIKIKFLPCWSFTRLNHQETKSRAQLHNFLSS